MGRESCLNRALIWALLAILGVQLLTAIAVLALGRREALVRRILPLLVSGAAGVLLATAFLDLLPDAARLLGTGPALWNILLLTLIGLFCVQAFAHALATREEEPGDRAQDETEGGAVRAAHSHAGTGHHHHAHAARPSSLLLGSALHSAVDGTAIAAAFFAGHRSGWIAAVAVGMHELPHRTGDFALLLHMGVEKRRAATLAVGAGAAALAGWLVVTLLGHGSSGVRWWLPVSAASFLYIALVDLLPELHNEHRRRKMLQQMACLIGGAVLAAALVHLPGE